MRRFTFVWVVFGLCLPGWVHAARYEIEPFARVRFVVEGPLDDVEGLTRSVQGELNLDPRRWAEGSGKLAVELRSLKTGIDKRDDDMREHFLETSRFPRALLQIDHIEGVTAADLSSGNNAEGEAVGSFELHGVRRAIRFHIRAREADGGLKVSGAFTVVLADYSIERPERIFIKLGPVAQVSFDASFRPAATPTRPENSPLAVLQPTVKEVQPALPLPVRKARAPAPTPPSVYLFREDASNPVARGERFFHSASMGGPGNTLSCAHCHSTADERKGQVQKDGHVRSANSMYNAGQRPNFWGGFTSSLPKAVEICAKQNLRQPDGIPAATAKDLSAFISAISPDPAPELDYRVLYRTFESPLSTPEGGDVSRGSALAFRYCMTCHGNGRTAPLLLQGLYEANWLVRRVRRLEGHQNKQEPPFAIDRLPDSELRDIVTWLTHAPAVFPARRASR